MPLQSAEIAVDAGFVGESRLDVEAGDDETGDDQTCATQDAWVERCRASLLEKDPLLAAEDTLDLAATLWDRPSCQLLAPERAADLLFAGQLGRSG